MSMIVEEASHLKDEGNKLFEAKEFDLAVNKYTEAIERNPRGGSETANYYKNRAACHLKMESYEDAISDCTAALDLNSNDPKALYRRALAHHELEQLEDSYRDAVRVLQLDPKNKAVQPLLAKLQPIMSEKYSRRETMVDKVKQMMDTVMNESEELEKRRTAANNLIVLAREESGADRLYKTAGILCMMKLMQSTDQELVLSSIRVLSYIANNNRERSTAIMADLTLKKILLLMSLDNEELAIATGHLCEKIILGLTGLERIRRDREKFEEARKKSPHGKRPWAFTYDRIDDEAMKLVDQVFKSLIAMLNTNKVSAHGRDNVIEVLIKYITRKDGVGWSIKFMDNNGLVALLEVASQVAEHKGLPTTENTRMHSSLLFQKIYDDLHSDKERDKFKNTAQAWFTEMMGDNIMESKVEAIMALAALLQGPVDVGSAVLAREGVLEMMLAMADSDNAVQCKYAVEALVHAAVKKDRVTALLGSATPILKQLYQSKNDYIKVRALVGLCKLASLGGTDASARSMAEGSTCTLGRACRKFLKNPTKDVDLRKWAAEGLVYLTLDADVKEELVEDTDALRSVIDLAKNKSANTYTLASILVNVSNSYDVPEIDKEMLELAKFAKQHIPETHLKDKDEFIQRRIQRLVDNGVINALVQLSRAESEKTRELLARVFLAICAEQKHRGLVTQQGGAKALIPLCIDNNTTVGKTKATQAVAKVAIVSDPNLAFPGQRMFECVRPLLTLLDIERKGLENFEGLMALTNLASISDSVRSRIKREKGFALVEHFMYEDHADLRRAATECICNLVLSEEFTKYFLGDNDRVKFVLLLSGETEDEKLVLAASGTLAILSSEREICGKILTCTEQWLDIIQSLVTADNVLIQHRGVHIVMNIVSQEKSFAKKIMDSPLFEFLMAITRYEEEDRQKARHCAEEALDDAVKFGLIQPYKKTCV